MASIQTYINQIKNAIYGKDVRSSIAEAIEKVNNDNEAYQTLADDATTALKQANAIVAGKVGIDDTNVGLGTSYSSKKIVDTLNDSLENLFPGGTNILRNTNAGTTIGTSGTWETGTWRVWGSGGTREVVNITGAPNPDIESATRMTITGTSTDSYSQRNIPLVSGLEYTMSCYVRLISGDGRGYILPYDNTTNAAIVTSAFTATSDWKRVSCTFAAKGILSAIFAKSTAAGVIEICGEKLELGNKETDWSPSPWDTGYNKSKITSLTAASSDITMSTVSIFKQGDIVVGSIRFNISTAPTTNGYKLITTLPEGYRPSRQVYLPFVGNVAYNQASYISAAGEIYFYATTAIPTAAYFTLAINYGTFS